MAVSFNTALVVDDSMLIRHTVCRLLETHGFTVESSCNGVEALGVLTHRLPSLIVTDLMMPKMGGTELIAELKKKRATAAIPVIVVAGRKSASEKQIQEESGADYVIFKDIDIIEQLEKALTALDCLPSLA